MENRLRRRLVPPHPVGVATPRAREPGVPRDGRSTARRAAAKLTPSWCGRRERTGVGETARRTVPTPRRLINGAPDNSALGKHAARASSRKDRPREQRRIHSINRDEMARWRDGKRLFTEAAARTKGAQDRRDRRTLLRSRGPFFSPAHHAATVPPILAGPRRAFHNGRARDAAAKENISKSCLAAIYCRCGIFGRGRANARIAFASPSSWARAGIDFSRARALSLHGARPPRASETDGRFGALRYWPAAGRERARKTQSGAALNATHARSCSLRAASRPPPAYANRRRVST